MVFSAEHYAPIVHNWVCWAAPVHDPVTGRQRLGARPVGPHPPDRAGHARVMARLIETAMPRSAHSTRGAYDDDEEPGLVMTLLGTAETRLDGQRLLLNRRQTEVLALLALHPEGLSLEQRTLVYGDQAVTLSTLKAEVSTSAPRSGASSSRPYRLMMPATTDVDHVLALRRGSWRRRSRRGEDLLPGTNSPALGELAEYVAVAVREALLADPQPDAVVRYSERSPYDAEVIEVCLAALEGRPHPAVPLLKGRSRSPAAEPPAGPDPPTLQPRSAWPRHSLAAQGVVHDPYQPHRRRSIGLRRRRTTDAARAVPP